MTPEECRAALGAQVDAQVYIKSRFAMCTGAVFSQIWYRNGAVVGTSQLVLMVIGTSAMNSREVKYNYYFTDMVKAGTTQTSGLMIKPDMEMPAIWPATAQIRQGGLIPNAKSFDQFKSDNTFMHTVTVDPGQGNAGSTDLVSAVYIPALTFTPPAGWTEVAELDGELFMLPPRWDAAPYLRNSTGGGDPTRRGAASFSVVGTLEYRATQGAPERAVAQHIKRAFTYPTTTIPYMAAKKVPGQVASDPLTRTRDTSRRDKNRLQAVAQCVRYYGEEYSEGGKYDCDEFPFASTYQGAALKEYDPEATAFNYSVKRVLEPENEAGGTLLTGFYANNRVLDSLEDGFIVKIID